MNRPKPEQFVVMQEVACGNAQVGTQWVEARTFPPETTLAEVWDWVVAVGIQTPGRTMIRPDMKQPGLHL